MRSSDCRMLSTAKSGAAALTILAVTPLFWFPLYCWEDEGDSLILGTRMVI